MSPPRDRCSDLHPLGTTLDPPLTRAYHRGVLLRACSKCLLHRHLATVSRKTALCRYLTPVRRCSSSCYPNSVIISLPANPLGPTRPDEQCGIRGVRPDQTRRAVWYTWCTARPDQTSRVVYVVLYTLPTTGC